MINGNVVPDTHQLQRCKHALASFIHDIFNSVFRTFFLT
jgi:hypothetical protein